MRKIAWEVVCSLILTLTMAIAAVGLMAAYGG